VAWLVVCYGVSAVGGLVTEHAVETWYQTLAKPGVNPPDWVFGPVWTVLYGLMAVAAWLVWASADNVARRRGIVWFCAQLAVNLMWSFVFFGARMLGLAVVDIALLWALIAVTMVFFFKVSRAAGWLMVPYLGWVTFAGYLNWAVWMMNPGFGR
jgi:tryptophan-rich sensory protein